MTFSGILKDFFSSILLFLIWFYQAAISPHLGRNCRYEPTCSNYAIDAIKKYGPLRGLALAVKRVLKCHPFSEGGYDPA